MACFACTLVKRFVDSDLFEGFEMETVGERLRFAMDTWGTRAGVERLGVRTFADLMRERFPNVPGTSRAMLQQYLSGAVEPPLAFLRAAADLLNVRPAWLGFGEAPMIAEVSEEDAARADNLLDDMLPAWDELPDAVRQGMIELADQLRYVDAVEGGPDEGVARLADAVLAPLVLFNAYRLRLTPDVLRRYYIGAHSLLSALWDEVRTGDTALADYTFSSLVSMRQELSWAARVRDTVLSRYAEIQPADVPHQHTGFNAESVTRWIERARTAPDNPRGFQCSCAEYHLTGDCPHMAKVRARREAFAAPAPAEALPPLTPAQAAELDIEERHEESGILYSAIYAGHSAIVGVSLVGTLYRSGCTCRKNDCGLLAHLQAEGRVRLEATLARGRAILAAEEAARAPSGTAGLPPLTADELEALKQNRVYYDVSPVGAGTLATAVYRDHSAAAGVTTEGQFFRADCSCGAPNCGLLQALMTEARAPYVSALDAGNSTARRRA